MRRNLFTLLRYEEGSSYVTLRFQKKIVLFFIWEIVSTGYPSAPPSATCSGRAKKSPGPSEEEEEEEGDGLLASPPPPSLNAPPEEGGGGRGGRRPRGESLRWRNQTILNGEKTFNFSGNHFFKRRRVTCRPFPPPPARIPAAASEGSGERRRRRKKKKIFLPRSEG